MSERPKPEPKPAPSSQDPREHARSALQTSIDRRG